MSSVEDRLYGPSPAAPAPVAPPPPPPAAPIPAPVVTAAPLLNETPPAADAPPAAEMSKKLALAPLPEAIAAIRNSSERRLYGSGPRPEVEALMQGSEGMPASADDRALVVNELSAITRDLGLDASEVSTFAAVARELHAVPLDEAGMRDMGASTVEALNLTFGQDASKAHRAAVALVDRDPRVAAWLAKSGAGSHPKVVVALAKIAMERRHG